MLAAHGHHHSNVRRYSQVPLRAISIVILLATLSGALASAVAQTSEPWGRAEARSIRSQVLGENRDIWVRTPPGYGESAETYPIVVVLDAEQHFEYVAGTTDLLARYFEMPRAIVVGIPNVARGRDFFTRTIAAPGTSDDGAGRFRGFLGDEVLPFIDREYRTNGLRLLIGHSLTGLSALSTMLTAPEAFGAVIALSPSLQYVENSIETAVVAWERTRSPRPVHVYLATASPREQPAIVAATDAFAARLEGREGVMSERAAIEGENHLTVPVPGIYAGLRWVFRDWARLSGITDGLRERGPEALHAHYAGLSEIYGTRLAVSVEQLIFFARRLGGDDPELALALLEEAEEIDPVGWTASVAKADRLEEAGDVDGALAALREAAGRASRTHHSDADAIAVEIDRLEG